MESLLICTCGPNDVKIFSILGTDRQAFHFGEFLSAMFIPIAQTQIQVHSTYICVITSSVTGFGSAIIANYIHIV